MSEIIEYRPINEDERIEIDQLAAKGLVLIGLQESAESSAIRSEEHTSELQSP